jgi:hypothetical protein
VAKATTRRELAGIDRSDAAGAGRPSVLRP